MTLPRRNLLIYGLLLAAWLVFLGWQVAEHLRVRHMARVALINRARDISDTLGMVIRAERHFPPPFIRRQGGFPFIVKERLEWSLNQLVRQGELKAIALLNTTGGVVVSAGSRLGSKRRKAVSAGEYWGKDTVTLANLVDLGTRLPNEPGGANTNTTIVVEGHHRDRRGPGDTNRPPPPRFRGGPDAPPAPSDSNQVTRARGESRFPGRPDEPRRFRGRRPFFGRPPWTSHAEYQALVQKQGLHGFLVVMSTAGYHAACTQDFWLRFTLVLLATISVAGSARARHNMAKSSELQIRLIRTSELNTHLREMNLAAAGLAHETRNPLNIIRGLAQMISKQEDTFPEVRKRAGEIVTETDRVSAQLNEFINYSRPREVRRLPVSLGAVIGEVVRALGCDIEEKQIRLEVRDEQLTVEADEQLLRQALFNLLLNAIQAVPANGEIRIVAGKRGVHEAGFEIRDNGPGVPAEYRTEIFKPYFTTQQQGTGLGLAVVQQIILAHGWEIECLPNEPQGAVFSVTHLKLVA